MGLSSTQSQVVSRTHTLLKKLGVAILYSWAAAVPLLLGLGGLLKGWSGFWAALIALGMGIILILGDIFTGLATRGLSPVQTLAWWLGMILVKFLVLAMVVLVLKPYSFFDSRILLIFLVILAGGLVISCLIVLSRNKIEYVRINQ